MSTQKRFRFGVQIDEASSLDEWVAKARRVEELGYSVLTLTDHFGEQLSPLPALVMAAARTERLRLGTYVLGNDYRHPAVVAKEAATVDLLSGGRFELGIGAGWFQQEYERLGIAFDPYRMRLERLEEAVLIIKGLLAGETVNLEGQHYSVHDLTGKPRPLLKAIVEGQADAVTMAELARGRVGRGTARSSTPGTSLLAGPASDTDTIPGRLHSPGAD